MYRKGEILYPSKFKETTENYMPILMITAGLALIYLMQDTIQDTMSRLIFLYFIAAMVFRIDARFPVAAAALLLFGALWVLAKDETFASSLAIYAYYFMVIGVMQILIYPFLCNHQTSSLEMLLCYSANSLIRSILLQSALMMCY